MKRRGFKISHVVVIDLTTSPKLTLEIRVREIVAALMLGKLTILSEEIGRLKTLMCHDDKLSLEA